MECTGIGPRHNAADLPGRPQPGARLSGRASLEGFGAKPRGPIRNLRADESRRERNAQQHRGHSGAGAGGLRHGCTRVVGFAVTVGTMLSTVAVRTGPWATWCGRWTA